MCKAVDDLTDKQRGIFHALCERLEEASALEQLKIVHALSEHTELTILAQRPYELPPPPAFPPAE